MTPDLPIRGFLIGWGVAAVFGGASALWLLRRAGLRGSQIALVIGALGAALIVGSKLLYLVEAWPAWTADSSAVVAALRSSQMRIPGGLLLATATGLLLARSIGVSYLWYEDTIVAATGLLIFGIRIGCFLEGCCFGRPSSLPWATSFPRTNPMTEVYWWQVTHGVIPLGAPATVPVQPLQLYFAMVGLLLFAGLAAYRSHVRYDGELLLLFAFFFLWSTWFLELLRAAPHEFVRQLVLVAAVAVTALAAVIEWRLRAAARYGETANASG